MVYSIQTEGRKRSLVLSNNRAIVLHQGGKCRWAGGVTGWLIRAQQPQSKRISCKGQALAGLKRAWTLGPDLDFTRYCFTSKLYCGSQSSIYPPPHTHKAYPIVILLHNYCATYAPPLTPSVYAIHHTILVIAISCKGQDQTTPVRRSSALAQEYTLCAQLVYCMR